MTWIKVRRLYKEPWRDRLFQFNNQVTLPNQFSCLQMYGFDRALKRGRDGGLHFHRLDDEHRCVLTNHITVQTRTDANLPIRGEPISLRSTALRLAAVLGTTVSSRICTLRA